MRVPTTTGRTGERSVVQRVKDARIESLELVERPCVKRIAIILVSHWCLHRVLSDHISDWLRHPVSISFVYVHIIMSREYTVSWIREAAQSSRTSF